MPIYRPTPGPYVGPQPFGPRVVVPVAAGADVTVALVGSVATSSTGTLAPSTSKALTGSVATGSTGTLAPSLSAPIAGSVATSAAGTLDPSSTVALNGTQAASAAGILTPTQNDVTVALTGSVAVSSAGTLGVSVSVALLGASAATSAGTLTPSGGDGAAVPSTAPTAAGRPARKRQRNYVVEIDGEDHIVGSVAEARALLDKMQEEAEQVAAVAIERASKATTKPIRKVLHDARKALQVPQITAPKLLDVLAKSALTSVESIYASTMRDIEIAALLRRAQIAEEDDEDVLMLMAL